jgi:hypothetical protein
MFQLRPAVGGKIGHRVTGSTRRQGILQFEGIGWPLLGTMQDTQSLDALRTPSHPVDDNKRCSGDHQLSGTTLSSHPSHRRVIGQQVDLVLDPVAVLDGGAHIVGRNIVKLRVSICECPREPSNDQALSPAAIRAASAARVFAHPFLASALLTQTVAGSSASRMASPTCSRNHLS